MSLIVVDELNGADSRGGPGRFTIRDAIVHEASPSEIIEAARELSGAFERTAMGRPAQLGQVPPGRYLIVRLGDEEDEDEE